MDLIGQGELDPNLDESPGFGQENMLGKAIVRGSELLCPIATTSPLAIAELPELRAYKLGKQKCSYNQVELVIKDVSGGRTTDLRVSEAIETAAGPEVDDMLRESCLKFNVRFVNNNRMHLYIYVVYATPYGTSRAESAPPMYHWIPVTRAKCRKACKGPVIRGLQRFGRMPRRNAAGSEGEDSWKEPRHLYIAIDEASTHVCPRHETSKFRLLAAAYDDKNQLIGTTVSSSIRVLANNDAPLGAASFKLHCHIKGGWGASSSVSPLRSSRIQEKTGVSRPPLQDIVQNSSPPTSYRQITTDDSAKHGENQVLALGIGIDLNKQISEEELDKEYESSDNEFRSPEATSLCRDSGDASKSEMENSLTDLCQRLLMVCVSRHDSGHSSVALRSLATALGARRKRILEIMNVLETVCVVQDHGKERFLWLGSTHIARALLRLKGRALEGASEVSKRSFIGAETDVHNPLQSISIKFVQLFLIHERASYISWEEMLEYIVDCRGHMNDPETIRAKTRRLGEVARIFTSLHLIKRIPAGEKLQSSVVYEWLGSQGVAEHLVTLTVSTVLMSKPDGRRVRTYQRRSRSETLSREEDSGAENTRRSYLVSTKSSCSHRRSSSPETLQPVSISSSSNAQIRDQTSIPFQCDNTQLLVPFRQVSRSETEDCTGSGARTITLARRKRGQKSFNSILGDQPVAENCVSALRTSDTDLALNTSLKPCLKSLTNQVREVTLDPLNSQQPQLANFKVQAEEILSCGLLRDTDHETDEQIQESSEVENVALDILANFDRSPREGEIHEEPPWQCSDPLFGQASQEENIEPDRRRQDPNKDERCSGKQLLFGRQVSVGSPWRKWQPSRPSSSEVEVSDLLLELQSKPIQDFGAIRKSSTASTEADQNCISNVPKTVLSQNTTVPFKKRKFNVTQDQASTEAGPIFRDRLNEKDQAQPSCRLGDIMRGGPEEQQVLDGRVGKFDPIGDLLKYIGPHAVKEILIRNPTSIYEYVIAARALFSKQCAERLLFRTLCTGRIRVKSKVLHPVAQVYSDDKTKLAANAL